MGFKAHVVTEDSASGAQIIDGSLKVDDGSNYDLHKLTRTATSGNRRTYTWAGWVKRQQLVDKQTFMFAESDDSNQTSFGFNHSSATPVSGFYFRTEISGTVVNATIDASLRDTTNFYHIVIAVDTTRSYQDERIRVYINGKLQTWGTSPGMGEDNETFINHNVQQQLFAQDGAPDLDAFISNLYFLDGLALGPGYFGFTDPLTNTWRPKKFREEGTTVNDGTQWSATIGDFTNGANVFNGNVTNQGYANNTGVTTLTTGKFVIKNNLRLLHNFREDGTYNLIINGVSINVPGNGTSSSTYRWADVDISALQLPITVTSLKYYISQTSGNSIRAIEVDGVIMQDSTTTNIDFGTNGFYLPFDGNSPIGEDKSGKGNDWTPSNFDNSAALDKATGALPILNTVSGGNYATVGVRTDAYANDLVLALPLVGNKEDVSNQINSGSTTKTVTANGNTHASSDKSNFYGGSFEFDGSTDSLTAASNSDFGMGTGDFTIEAWVHPTTLYSSNFIVCLSGSDSVFGYGNDGTLNIQLPSSGAPALTQLGPVIVNNKWNHFACVRESGNLRGYVDGVLAATVDSATTDMGSSGTVTIGDHPTLSREIKGYLQDLRIYKGVAKYTSDFIPASTNPDIVPDTPSGVSGGSIAKIIEGAVHFDGSGDYLSIPKDDFTDIASDDAFTIESFVYFKDLDNYSTIFASSEDSFTTGGFKLEIYDSKLRVQGNSFEHVSGSTTLSTNRWHHFAFSRTSGGNAYSFVDGVLVNSTTNGSATFEVTWPRDVGIGGKTDNTEYLNGFISNLRFVNGTALYTSAFTPPTAPLTNVTNTKLLCCQSNTLTGSAAVSPNISGINDGTVWSSTVTGPTRVQDRVANAFKGSSGSPGAIPAYPGTLRFEPGFTGISTLAVRGWYAGSGVSLHINGVAQSPSGGAYDIGITTTRLDSIVWTAVNGFNYYRIDQIEIDGVTLVDPVVGADDSNEAATTFNPFNTDINTVRGQESGYPTLDPNNKLSNAVLSKNNLSWTCDNSGAGTVLANVAVDAGKYYWEVTVDNGNRFHAGVHVGAGDTLTIYDAGAILDNNWAFRTDGAKVHGGSESSTGFPNVSGIGNVIQLAYDADGGNLWFGANGRWFEGNPSRLSGPSYTGVTSTAGISPMINRRTNDNGASINFGQKPFKYAPPIGFSPINASTIRSATRPISNPEAYFDTFTYTGDGSANRGITGLKLNAKPDFLWIRVRNEVNSHYLFDTVRGADKALFSDLNNDENDYSGSGDGRMTSFNVNGFTVSASASTGTNANNDTYIAYAWKAGGDEGTFNRDGVGYASASAAGLSAGTITPTGASIGTKQGFSIITWTGTGSVGDIPHGLTQDPDVIMIKNRENNSSDWYVFGKFIDDTFDRRLTLNGTDTAQSSSSALNGTSAISSTIVKLGANEGSNGSTDDMLMYAWHSVPGLQKFGTYIGNGSSDGPVIKLGFRPALLIVKSMDAGEPWAMYDNARGGDFKNPNTYNANAKGLYADSDAVENDASGRYKDFTNDGFKVRGTSGEQNSANKQYFYMAWAEAPAFNLYGAQSNAR